MCIECSVKIPRQIIAVQRETAKFQNRPEQVGWQSSYGYKQWLQYKEKQQSSKIGQSRSDDSQAVVTSFINDIYKQKGRGTDLSSNVVFVLGADFLWGR